MRAQLSNGVCNNGGGDKIAFWTWSILLQATWPDIPFGLPTVAK